MARLCRRGSPRWPSRSVARSTCAGHRHRHVTSRHITSSRYITLLPSRYITSRYITSHFVTSCPFTRFKVQGTTLHHVTLRHVTSRYQVPVSRYLLSWTFLVPHEVRVLHFRSVVLGDAVLRPPLELQLVAVADPLGHLQLVEGRVPAHVI